ncbi:MAG TPA: helix-turn-helix domain-containing protein [Lachnospiraceae bacterium]|nr:helix-turn-helix domain-containing protein [Lachnospiraceae bacterium]
MEKSQFSTISGLVDLIEDNIKNNIDLELVAEKVDLSKFYLERVFKSITGKSLISYVRERKLSESAGDLLRTNLRVIDIASEYQYEQEQSYIRAFRQMFHVTPYQFRKQRKELPIATKFDVNIIKNAGQGLIVKPRMCLKSEFYLQGMVQEIIHSVNYDKGTSKTNAIDWMNKYLPTVSNSINKDVYYGYVIYTEHSEYSNYYATCVEIKERALVREPMVQYTIPTHEYAVFRYIGFHSPYEITYKTLYDIYNETDLWIEKSSYRQAAPFHFEKVDLSISSDDYCELDIYFPMIMR